MADPQPETRGGTAGHRRTRQQQLSAIATNTPSSLTIVPLDTHALIAVVFYYLMFLTLLSRSPGCVCAPRGLSPRSVDVRKAAPGIRPRGHQRRLRSGQTARPHGPVHPELTQHLRLPQVPAGPRR